MLCSLSEVLAVINRPSVFAVFLFVRTGTSVTDRAVRDHAGLSPHPGGRSPASPLTPCFCRERLEDKWEVEI